MGVQAVEPFTLGFGSGCEVWVVRSSPAPAPPSVRSQGVPRGRIPIIILPLHCTLNLNKVIFPEAEVATKTSHERARCLITDVWVAHSTRLILLVTSTDALNHGYRSSVIT